MTLDGWVKAHPFLRPLSEWLAQVDRAAAEVATSAASAPAFDDYRDEFLEGVPLLQSTAAAVDLDPAEGMVRALVKRLAARGAAGSFARELALLDEELGGERERERADPRRVVSWLLGEAGFTPSAPGLLRCLGWNVLARFLRPLVDAFARWRDEERWHRSHCPTCGSPPAMALLVGEEHGRPRFLVCGGCATRWRYPRNSCPFCETDTRRIPVLAVESEPALRIDWCESCRGYLKTCSGKGDEEVLLADWTTLHLDLLAKERGLERKAASLYELDAAPPAG
jgi:FdhE protein